MGQFRTSALFTVLVFLISCSSDRELEDDRHTRGDHVWKDQVQAYDKVKEVEGILQKAAEKNRDSIEQQSQ